MTDRRGSCWAASAAASRGRGALPAVIHATTLWEVTKIGDPGHPGLRAAAWPAFGAVSLGGAALLALAAFLRFKNEDDWGQLSAWYALLLALASCGLGLAIAGWRRVRSGRLSPRARRVVGSALFLSVAVSCFVLAWTLRLILLLAGDIFL